MARSWTRWIGLRTAAAEEEAAGRRRRAGSLTRDGFRRRWTRPNRAVCSRRPSRWPSSSSSSSSSISSSSSSSSISSSISSSSSGGGRLSRALMKRRRPPRRRLRRRILSPRSCKPAVDPSPSRRMHSRTRTRSSSTAAASDARASAARTRAPSAGSRRPSHRAAVGALRVGDEQSRDSRAVVGARAGGRFVPLVRVRDPRVAPTALPVPRRGTRGWARG